MKMKLFQRNKNALYIENILINIPKDIDKELNITTILLSNELAVDLNTLHRLEKTDIQIYCSKDTFFALNSSKPELYHIIESGEINIDKTKVQIVTTKCSIKDINNLSFKIKDTFYGAYANLDEILQMELSTCMILDATFSDKETYKQILTQSNTNLVNMTILINNTKTYHMDNELLHKYWDLKKVSQDLKVLLSKDALEYIVPKSDTLNSIKLGKQCNNIKNNQVLLSTEQTTHSKQIYTDNRKAYGVLNLLSKTPVSESWLNKNKQTYNLSKVERNLRFNDKQIYAYTFEILEEYEPMSIEHMGLFDTMFDTIIFTDSIKDLYTYDVKSRCNRNLSRDHALVHAWYIKKQKQTFKYSLEDIINLHNIITTELHKRNIQHDILEELDKVCITDNIPDMFKQLDNIILSSEMISISTNKQFDNAELLVKDIDIPKLHNLILNKINIPLGTVCVEDYIPLYDLVLIKKPIEVKTHNNFENIQLNQSEKYTSFEALLSKLW